MNRLGMTLKEVYQFIKTDLRKYCEQHCYANVNYIAVQEYYGEEKIIHSVSELNDNTVKELLDYVAGQIVCDYLHKETMGKDYIITIEDIYSDHSVLTIDDVREQNNGKNNGFFVRYNIQL